MSLSHAPTFLRTPTTDQIKPEHTIDLVDQTINSSSAGQDPDDDAERNNSDAFSRASSLATDIDPGNLYKRLTNNSASLQQSVRREITKQKYARYGQDRYDVASTKPTSEPADGSRQQRQTSNGGPDKSYLERAQARARNTLRRKKALGRGTDEQDIIVDVLYENQRGVFFFGIPKYSSSSLLPSDPKPWQNAQFRTSPSDIRNAQVPDPSWEWAWKSWYVDMNRDVDEEGWEYCFAFVGHGGSAFTWHGNHSWFNSFVRRRRWLRMRRRRDMTHHTREQAHELTADYFTIHPRTVRPSSLVGGQTRSALQVPALKRVEEVGRVDKMEILSVGDLFFAMRRATVDREKLVAVRKFTDSAGDELVYLSERMDDVMRMLVFQTSKRQLLSYLVSRHEEVHQYQKGLEEHRHGGDEEKQEAHDTASRRADYLIQAIHAAEAHVKQLEYWSDMKEISTSAMGADREEAHDQPSFRNKQSAHEGAPALHRHPEHTPNPQKDDSTSDTATGDSKKWFDTVAQQPPPRTGDADAGDLETDENELEQYTTAAESASELREVKRWKGKGRAHKGDLDGVQEEEGVP